uniref:Putative NB-ARC n=1 Tax=Helianthus annuus TaxID=4232 RepID=A0A251UWG5_HELAN
MAEAAAAALVKVIFEKLADEAFKKYARSQNIHSELKELGITLSQIQALLNDASNKEITDESVRLWLNRLQHLAYDIDDVLDDVATEAMHRELTPESEASTSMVRKLIPACCTNFSLSHRLSPKLDSITTQLQYLEKQKADLGLIVKEEKPKNTSRRNETSLLESDVVGREGEKKRLLNQLLVGESSKENFSIIPIVGLGGVGKTTLARILYNDKRVKDHFELMAWVCVSDEFDVFKISETIFECVATENKQFKDVNQLQIALREQFKDKRFLLVLDDVWNQNYDDWEKLVRPFHSGAAGSRVIMTTRQQDLLKKIGFNHVDNLESLSHEDALSLLALHALDVDNFDSHETLKPQAEGIVKKCGGLPLALKAIGRLLRTKTEGEEWDEVLKSKIWDLENADAIVPALRLSYHDLPADLKRLFAYCSLFPKDFMFDKEELILLWIAEGYLNESTADKSPERLGHEYFEKLLSRSFFQPAPNGGSFFVMHDLMNDLAAFVAGEYFLRFENQTEMAMEALAKYRHMSFMRERYVGFQKFEAFQRARSLRTLLAVYVGVEQSWNTFYISNKILVDLLPQLPLLRVLSLRRFNISEVPDAICSLNHLRYLNLSETRISKLPENVGNLYNLQTLIVFGCNCLTTLPKSFLKLKKLRHFDIGETPCLKKLPLGIGELKNLQTLPKVIVGGDNDFAITKLKGLENLHGELSIEGLHKVQIPMHAREANLSQKRLTKLKLKWGDGSQRGTLEKEVLTDGSQRGTHEKEVLTELKPHTDTLKHFGVEYYGGVEFPGWVVDPSFRELVHVSIRGCKKCTSLPPFGQLPSLKELLIQGMDEVKVIGTELVRTIGVASCSLQILGFEDMQSWEAWSTHSEVMFPCLRELRIKNCPKLIDVSLEALPSLRVLRIEGCGESVLRSLVQAASSTTKLKIRSILGLTDEVWRGVVEYLGAVEELSIQHCNEIRYLWESNTEASKVLERKRRMRITLGATSYHLLRSWI